VTDWVLKPVPLTAERFAPFGDVIETSASLKQPMNDARFERFGNLAKVDVDAGSGGHVAISIVRSKTPTTMPYQFDLVERHSLGSQAFIPLAPFSFTVVVAPAGESVEVADLRAFVTNGSQGINYHRGVWHMPLIATAAGLRFVVVDRTPGDGNCEEVIFDQTVILPMS
jgi:ureidoglycolate lyase